MGGHNSTQHVGKVYQSLSNSNHGKGVAIILTNNFPEYSMIDKQTEEEGRIVLLNIKLEDCSQKKKVMFLHSKNKPSRKGYKGEC